MFDFYPNEIKEQLDKTVIKQERAKRAVSVALNNHFTSQAYNEAYDEVGQIAPRSLPRNIVLLIGDTGTGKSHIVKSIIKGTNYPHLTVDMSKIMPNGYKGNTLSESIDEFSKRPYQGIDNKYGIIYLDEVDKIKKISNEHAAAYNLMMQQELLSILEGEEMDLFDIGKTFIILSGAFVGLQDIVDKRKNKKVNPTIGFNNEPIKDSTDRSEEILPEDLIEYGMIPELVGRITNIVKMETLTKEDLVQIMLKAEDSILEQYKLMFELNDTELEFETSFLEEVAENAIKKKLGARGLRSELGKVMDMISYDHIGRYKRIKVLNYNEWEVDDYNT